MRDFVYIRSEPNLWTVGFYAPDESWHPESDHDTREAAAERVAELNGGGPRGLSFQDLRKANVARCEESFHALYHWNPMEWGAACAGEVGEGINAAKKLRRVRDSEQYKKTLPTTDVTVQDVVDEIADAVIYADLWSASLGVDLGAAVARKFNQTSEKVCSHRRLPESSTGGRNAP